MPLGHENQVDEVVFMVEKSMASKNSGELWATRIILEMVWMWQKKGQARTLMKVP